MVFIVGGTNNCQFPHYVLSDPPPNTTNQHYARCLTLYNPPRPPFRPQAYRAKRRISLGLLRFRGGLRRIDRRNDRGRGRAGLYPPPSLPSLPHFCGEKKRAGVYSRISEKRKACTYGCFPAVGEIPLMTEEVATTEQEKLGVGGGGMVQEGPSEDEGTPRPAPPSGRGGEGGNGDENGENRNGNGNGNRGFGMAGLADVGSLDCEDDGGDDGATPELIYLETISPTNGDDDEVDEENKDEREKEGEESSSIPGRALSSMAASKSSNSGIKSKSSGREESFKSLGGTAVTVTAHGISCAGSHRSGSKSGSKSGSGAGRSKRRGFKISVRSLRSSMTAGGESATTTNTAPAESSSRANLSSAGSKGRSSGQRERNPDLLWDPSNPAKEEEEREDDGLHLGRGPDPAAASSFHVAQGGWTAGSRQQHDHEEVILDVEQHSTWPDDEIQDPGMLLSQLLPMAERRDDDNNDNRGEYAPPKRMTTTATETALGSQSGEVLRGTGTGGSLFLPFIQVKKGGKEEEAGEEETDGHGQGGGGIVGPVLAQGGNKNRLDNNAVPFAPSVASLSAAIGPKQRGRGGDQSERAVETKVEAETEGLRTESFRRRRQHYEDKPGRSRRRRRRHRKHHKGGGSEEVEGNHRFLQDGYYDDYFHRKGRGEHKEGKMLLPRNNMSHSPSTPQLRSMSDDRKCDPKADNYNRAESIRADDSMSTLTAPRGHRQHQGGGRSKYAPFIPVAQTLDVDRRLGSFMDSQSYMSEASMVILMRYWRCLGPDDTLVPNMCHQNCISDGIIEGVEEYTLASNFDGTQMEKNKRISRRKKSRQRTTTTATAMTGDWDVNSSNEGNHNDDRRVMIMFEPGVETPEISRAKKERERKERERRWRAHVEPQPSPLPAGGVVNEAEDGRDDSALIGRSLQADREKMARQFQKRPYEEREDEVVEKDSKNMQMRGASTLDAAMMKEEEAGGGEVETQRSMLSMLMCATGGIKPGGEEIVAT